LEHQINEEIRDKEVRLIDSDGSQLGIVTIQQAMETARALSGNDKMVLLLNDLTDNY
jgi:translation initiation factor IF-3